MGERKFSQELETATRAYVSSRGYNPDAECPMGPWNGSNPPPSVPLWTVYAPAIETAFKSVGKQI